MHDFTINLPAFYLLNGTLVIRSIIYDKNQLCQTYSRIIYLLEILFTLLNINTEDSNREEKRNNYTFV